MFKLEVDPEFTATVEIPVPGKPSERVKFKFRHKTLDEFETLMDGVSKKESTPQDVVRQFVAGWEAPSVEPLTPACRFFRARRWPLSRRTAPR